METILIVEDDPDLLAGLSRLFSWEGLRTVPAERGQTALSLLTTERPDLILLDLELPDISGFDVCAKARDMGFSGPIVMLTVRNHPGDIVAGLDHGADDYIKKPYHRQELLARVRAHLRRSRQWETNPKMVEAGNLKIDLASETVWKEGREIKLTATEFEILRILVEERGRTVTRGRLVSAIWKAAPGSATRTIDTHIGNLRKKLETDPSRPHLIVTAHGHGYRLVFDVDFH